MAKKKTGGFPSGPEEYKKIRFKAGNDLTTKMSFIKGEKSSEKDGVWRTVRGRHVFIEEGKTLEQALGHKPGVENQKKIEDKKKKKSKWFEDNNPAPKERSGGFDNPLNTWRRGKTGWERNDKKR